MQAKQRSIKIGDLILITGADSTHKWGFIVRKEWDIDIEADIFIICWSDNTISKFSEWIFKSFKGIQIISEGWG